MLVVLSFRHEARLRFAVNGPTADCTGVLGVRDSVDGWGERVQGCVEGDAPDFMAVTPPVTLLHQQGVSSLRTSRLAPIYNTVTPSLKVFATLFGKALQAQASRWLWATCRAWAGLVCCGMVRFLQPLLLRTMCSCSLGVDTNTLSLCWACGRQMFEIIL